MPPPSFSQVYLAISGCGGGGIVAREGERKKKRKEREKEGKIEEEKRKNPLLADRCKEKRARGVSGPAQASAKKAQGS